MYVHCSIVQNVNNSKCIVDFLTNMYYNQKNGMDIYVGQHKTLMINQHSTRIAHFQASINSSQMWTFNF